LIFRNKKPAQVSCATQSVLCALGQGKTKNTAPSKQSGGVFRFSLAILFSSFFAIQNLQAETAANTVVINQATVSYQFLGQSNIASDTEEFITARAADGSGTPSIITLMHNSIDFSGQLQAAQGPAVNPITPTPNALTTVFSGSSSRARALTSTTAGRTTASSNGETLSGSFSVQEGQCATDSTGNSLVAQPTPTDYQGNTLSLPGTLNLSSDEFFKVGDTIFVHLQDLDQNSDPTAVEKIVVTIISENGLDTETIQLTETDTSTGLFTGYIQSVDINTQGSTPFNCQLSVTNNSRMQARYQDKVDAVDISAAAALFDPNSYVINADTGEYINGIEVTLIDASTDLPAAILSNDGAVFPSTVTTGGSVFDSKGNETVFPYGGFAFPVLNSGSYEIRVAQSVYHRYPIPDNKTLEDINALPNGPFNLNEQGSRALAFDVPGITFRMDVPLDPKDNSVLLTKTANKSSAGVGELVSYNIQLQNSEIPGDNILIHDLLPQGFRYVPGSVTLDGIALSEPTISSDGRALTFTIATIEVDDTLNIRYVARIGVNTPVGKATNTASLEDDILIANVTNAHIEIKEDLFSEKSRLFGRVYIGDCENKTEQEGISGVRIYLENGNYVVTDEDGLWHMEAQDPGTHVVQLDTDTLPKYLDLMSCDNYGTHAGREYSQFVDVEPGTMWRSDFVVKLKPPSVGEVIQRLSSQVVTLSEQEIATNWSWQAPKWFLKNCAAWLCCPRVSFIKRTAPCLMVRL